MAQAIHVNQQQPGQSPKRRRNNPYRDGASKCAQQFDVFEMIRNPHAVKRPPAEPLTHQAKGSTQRKIEQEIQKKFEENSPRLIWNRFRFLAILVKYVFLAFALPFYLVFYQIPKVVFFKWIPFVVKAVAKRVSFYKIKCMVAINSTLNTIKAPFIKIANTIKKIRSRLSRTYLAFISIPSTYWKVLVTRFQRYYKKYLQSVDWIKQSPTHLNHAIQAGITSFNTFFISLKKRWLKLVGHSKSFFQDNLREIKVSAGHFSRIARSKITNEIFTLTALTTALKKQVQVLRDLPQNWRKFIANHALYSKLTTRLLALNLSQYNRKYFHKKNQEIANYLHLHGKKINEKIKHLQASIGVLLAGLPVGYLVQFQKYLESLRTVLLKKVRALFVYIQSSFRKTVDKVTFKFNLVYTRLAHRVRIGDIFQRYSKKTVDVPVGKPKYGFQERIQRAIPRLEGKVKVLSSEVKLAVSYVHKKSQEFLQPKFQIGRSYFNSVILQVRITLAWAKVLCIYGLYQLAIVSKQIGLGL